MGIFAIFSAECNFLSVFLTELNYKCPKILFELSKIGKKKKISKAHFKWYCKDNSNVKLEQAFENQLQLKIKYLKRKCFSISLTFLRENYRGKSDKRRDG